jgi:hypothetical protein
MASPAQANLINLYSFYLATMFVLSLMRRWSVYYDTLAILIAVRGRWPKLVERMAAHRKAIVNWSTVRPVVLVFVLMAVQMIASRLLWPQARLTLLELIEPAWQLVPFLAALVPMLAVDVYFLIAVGRFDRAETVKYLDQAERWSGTWKARAVRTMTFGRIDPDRQVEEGVRQGMAQLGQTVSWAMWWVSVQMGLRLLFGLTVWLLWALR